MRENCSELAQFGERWRSKKAFQRRSFRATSSPTLQTVLEWAQSTLPGQSSSFEDEQDVANRANDTAFGLAAYVYTQDLGQSWRVSDSLQYGMVALNESLLSTDLAPFGGVKTSGIGREGGKYGLLEYTDIKYRLLG